MLVLTPACAAPLQTAVNVVAMATKAKVAPKKKVVDDDDESRSAAWCVVPGKPPRRFVPLGTRRAANSSRQAPSRQTLSCALHTRRTRFTACAGSGGGNHTIAGLYTIRRLSPRAPNLLAQRCTPVFGLHATHIISSRPPLDAALSLPVLTATAGSYPHPTPRLPPCADPPSRRRPGTARSARCTWARSPPRCRHTSLARCVARLVHRSRNCSSPRVVMLTLASVRATVPR